MVGAFLASFVYGDVLIFYDYHSMRMLCFLKLVAVVPFYVDGLSISCCTKAGVSTTWSCVGISESTNRSGGSGINSYLLMVMRQS